MKLMFANFKKAVILSRKVATHVVAVSCGIKVSIHKMNTDSSCLEPFNIPWPM